jgi:hypothetical protein
MAKPTIEAITDATLPEFAAFLNANMSVPRSTEAWLEGLSVHWRGPRPNYGFLMRDNGHIVGGIGAIYAERTIRGTTENFCNITSWCVLDSHRKYGMQLAMAVIAQPGYHFTDFSPTKVVGGVLRFLNFKPLDESVVVIANLPSLILGGKVLTSANRIEEELSGVAKEIWHDHAKFPWLRHILVGTPGSWCHVIYKRDRFKGLPCSRILYVSDATILDRHFHRLSGHFLWRGMVSTHIEKRFLVRLPWPSRLRTGFNQKIFLSDRLKPEDIDYLYSESVALNL